MRLYTLALLLLLTAASYGADWPQWHGINRDGISAEKGLLKSWPADGPKLLWSVDGLGQGFGSIAVAGHALYFTTDFHNEGWVYCLDLQGKLRWKSDFGADGQANASYARSTPTVDGDRLYVMSGQGAVVCLNATTGALRWSVDTVEAFQAKRPPYGIAESVVLAGDVLVCTPGGEKASVIGLDKYTGRLCWATSAVQEPSGYNQPIVIKRGKRKLAVVMTAKSMLGLDAARGTVLWRVPYNFDGQQCFTPLFADDILYAPVATGSLGAGFKLSADGGSISKLWQQNRMTVNMGGLVIHDGYLYGANGNWRCLCLELKTGNIMYESIRKIKCDATLYADGMLYMYSWDGMLRLVKATPSGYECVSECKITLGDGDCYAHPALANGVLYLRHGEVLMAYRVK